MIRHLALLATFVVALSACANDDVATGPTPTGDEYEVLATAYPLYEILSRMGGERFRATNLRPEGALSNKPLSEDEKRQILEAKVLFIIGQGAQPEIEALAATRTLPTLEVAPFIENPFVWLDPNQIGLLIERARVILTAYDPGGAPLFAKNARLHGREIAELDKQMARTLATCRRRDLVTTFPQFGHLTRRYDLQQVAVQSEGEIAAVVASSQPRTIFFETFPPVAEARRNLQNGYRSAVLTTVVDQTDQARRGGANYRVFMNLNLDAIGDALECTKDTEQN